jgi:hypothetical protein
MCPLDIRPAKNPRKRPVSPLAAVPEEYCPGGVSPGQRQSLD